MLLILVFWSDGVETVLSALRAAGEQTRLRLLALCRHSDLTVSDLCRIVGQSQPRISRHLKILCDAGLLDRVPEGAWAFYRLAQNRDMAAIGRCLAAMIPREDPLFVADKQRMEQVQAERAERAAAYFRDHALRWETIRSLHVDEAEVEGLLTAKLGSASIADLVDVGTGTGRILTLLGPRAERAVGIDLSREMLAIARAALERNRLEQCRVRLGDMYALPLSDRFADVVTIHQVLHFAERPGAVIAEAARILKPGGRLCMVDFAPHAVESLRETCNHRRLGFSHGDVAAWCARNDLSVVEAVDLPGNPLTVTLWLALKTPLGSFQSLCNAGATA